MNEKTIQAGAEIDHPGARDAFEKWAKDQGYQRDELARNAWVTTEYFNLNVEMAWKAWQASATAALRARGAVPDERAAFEKWATETTGASVEPWMEHAPEAGYKNTRLNDYRDGWFARAALTAAAPQPPAALPGDEP